MTSDWDSLVISVEVDDFVDRVTGSRGQGWLWKLPSMVVTTGLEMT